MTVPQFFGWQRYFRQLQTGGQAAAAPRVTDPERMQSILERAFGG